MCWLHKWTKWEQFQVEVFYSDFPGQKGVQQMQRRHCEKCGYAQRDEVGRY